MDTMDIDSPAESNPPPPHTKPCDRIVERLAQLGISEEYIERRYLGLVDFIKDNPSRIPELVAAILPLDEEVAEVVRESKLGSKKLLNPTMKYYFRECMVWLQWLMFSGDPTVALKNLSKMSSGRGVCGSVWGNNDIAYRCRTCEHDPTCAICVPCFQNGNHKDHDYSIIYTGGGCCDCGDVTAWKREGFCSKHKGAEQIQPLPEEYADSVGPTLGALFIRWKKKLGSAETISQENPKANDLIAQRKKVANELTFVVVEMLLEFCKHSESFLSFVSRKVITSVGLLEILVRAERFLCELVAKKLIELLLKLLGEPLFKYEFSKAFLSYYPLVVHELIKDDTKELLKKYPLLSTFSVQIFTVPTLTPRLVREMNLLPMLLGCLGDIFVHCAGEDGRLQVIKWGEKLYETTVRVVEDIRFVMSHSIVPKYVTHDQRDILLTWMRLLSFLQGMGPLKRENGIHIEEENDNVNLLFVLDHMLANIHSLLVDGAFSIGEEVDDDILIDMNKQDMDEKDSTRHAKVGRLSRESSVCGVSARSTADVSAMQIVEVKSNSISHSSIPSSVTCLTYECLRAIDNWLEADSYGAATSTHDSSSSSSNFLSLKNTFSKIRRGKYIFGGFTCSFKGHNRQFLPLYSGLHTNMDVENTSNVGQDSKPTVYGQIDTVSGEESVTEGDNSPESDAFRILSSPNWANIVYDVSSQDVSVHIPLHRLLSLLLQRALRSCYGEFEPVSLTGSNTVTSSASIYDDFFGFILRGCHPCGFSAFVMEHPLRNRVFCAEVHAGMWRKNGDAAILSSEWYRSVRWSEQGLELDLFLLQCCAALAPAELYVHRIVQRFGLSDYLALKPGRSSEYEPVLMQEMLTLIIQIVQERRFSGLSPAENMKRELIHKLAIGDATRSQLVKSLPCDLSNYDRLQEVLDSVAVYSNPSGFNQGMYSMRWTYWKELDLYHPRWNSRDLQVAEERYTRHCGVSAMTTQLPRWTEIHPPLKGVARIATCEVVLKIIRAVFFYAVFSDKLSEARAPDGVLIMALHLLALGLDICIKQSELKDLFSSGDFVPILAFAYEEIHEGLNYGVGGQSLLSLLVSLMRMHKRDNLDNFVEADSCNISSLIESSLKKFGELDTGCVAKLQELAPEVVVHLSQSIPSCDVHSVGSASDSEKRKAKARERQAAILAKMRAEQSKFLLSLNSADDDDSKSGLEESNTKNEQNLGESAEDVCCLCHDSKSRNPVSFLILLQKSRLLSLIERGPPRWDRVHRSEKELVYISTNQVIDQVQVNSSSCSEAISSNQLVQLVQNAVSEYAVYAQPGEISSFMEFVKANFPSLRSIQVPHPLKNGSDITSSGFDVLEQDIYLSARKEINDSIVSSSGVNSAELSATEGGITSHSCAVSALLGKYISALSGDMTEHPSCSESAVDDITRTESTSQIVAYDKFGPIGCDGLYLSSCGHAVHQDCLDRYLSSLKERHVGRIVFEGGHIVDPDQGEFLCPVCRRLANSVLPSLPGDFQRVWKEPILSNFSSTHNVGHLPSGGENNSFMLQQSLLVLRSVANFLDKGDFWKTFPLQRNEKMKDNLDSVYRVLFKMYFPDRQDNPSRSTRANYHMIMWDTLKYSLVSMEIAARCDRTQMIPAYGLNALYRELESSSGFILSLLLKIVLSLRSKNSLYVLQRFRGIQLFAESICSGVSLGHASSTCLHGCGMLSILKHVEKEVPFPDMQFWNLAAVPILAHDAFISLMWVLFCLPHPFLSCEESLLSMIHMFYAASVAQGILAYCGLHAHNSRDVAFHDCLISDISNFVGEFGWIQQYFVSNYIGNDSDAMDTIRRLSFPYLRRCALLWKLLSTSVSEPFCHSNNELDRSSHFINDSMTSMDADIVELKEVKKLEKIFSIPSLEVVLKDQVVRSLVMKWLQHFRKEYEVYRFQHVLHSMPAVPFKLMQLPHLYQDLLERYIKRRCSDCKNVIEEPALCLLCGKLCSLNWKTCCSACQRESTCQAHAMACGAGTGVYLLIKRTTILLQRCARRAHWPSPYLDAFGEEDIEMHRGKPLYLNEERYAALTYMVASHGLDRSSKVLGQTTIGSFILL